MLLPNYRANPVWLDPFCRNLELAAQAEHEDDLPENLSEIADLWNSPTRTHGTFGREPAAVKPDDDRYLRAAIQEYDNIAKLGQIIREGPIKVSPLLQGPVPRPCLNLTPTQGYKEMVYLDPPSIRMGVWALGLIGSAACGVFGTERSVFRLFSHPLHLNWIPVEP